MERVIPEGSEEQLLDQGLRELGIEPVETIIHAFGILLEELLLWNSRTNLVGTSDRREIIVRHILDSLSVYHLLSHRKGTILDIGAGAGFPSLPLAIVSPYRDIAAVEKRRRRAAFLQNVQSRLGLHNFRVFERDVRELGERFDIVVARAVGPLPVLYTLARRVLKERAVIIAFKGKIEEIDREMKSLEEKMKGSGDHNIRIQRVKVPHLKEEERNVVIIEMAG
jgi:16S rRNA (guanine527-N7)-methyltransferase